MEKVRITVFADPVCTWCWGSVPVLRAVGYRFGKQVEIKYVMGGMIEDVVTFMDRRDSVGGNIALSNRNIHASWIEASARHGMPVAQSGFHLFSEERRSTISQNLAYIASEVYAERNENSVKPGLSKRFLRSLQEKTAVDAVVTNSVDELVGIASTLGIDPGTFKLLLQSDEVLERYRAGKRLCAAYEVNKFPTFRIEYRGEENVIRGYTSWEQMCNGISRLTGGDVNPLNDGREKLTVDNVAAFVATLGTAYPVEIATAFSLERKSGHSALYSESYTGLPDVVAGLVEDGKVAMVPKGNGFMFFTINNGTTISQIRGREHAGVL